MNQFEIGVQDYENHIILVERIVARNGLPRSVLPSGILKIEKYCPGLKVPVVVQERNDIKRNSAN